MVVSEKTVMISAAENSAGQIGRRAQTVLHHGEAEFHPVLAELPGWMIGRRIKGAGDHQSRMPAGCKVPFAKWNQ